MTPDDDPAGIGWGVLLSTLNAIVQNIFPSLTRARGISVYLLVFYAGMSIGSIAWGAIAQWITLSSTLLIASIFLALMGLAAMRVLAEKKTVLRSIA